MCKKLFLSIFISLVLIFTSCNNAAETQTLYKFIDIKVSTTISAGYAIGDVLLYNETESKYFLESKEYFVANVASKNFSEIRAIGILSYEINGVPYFVGLKRAPQNTCWALESAIGYGSIPLLAGNLGSGELWGIKSNAIVKKFEDFDGTNYPAMYWVQNYEPYDASGEKGDWFLPSAFEAVQIFNASEAHDEVLTALKTVDSSYELFWDSNKYNYWTSSTNEREKVINSETGETIIESKVWVYRNELSAIRDEKKSDTTMSGLGTMSALAVKRFDYKKITERKVIE